MKEPAMATITSSNPTAVRAPTGYTHGLLLQGVERRLIVSGQVGVAPDGSVPSTGEGQIAQAFANLRAVLEANGMSVTNLVKTTVFLTDRPLLASFRAAHDAVYGRACAVLDAALCRRAGGPTVHGGDRGRGCSLARTTQARRPSRGAGDRHQMGQEHLGADPP